jgi:Tol biopolymer transport system component
VGTVLYELVAGHPPFGGRTMSDILANVLRVEPDPLSRSGRDCPPELQRIVAKCLRKDRDHRYQDMRDVALDLEAFGDTLSGTSVEPRRLRSRWPVGLALVAAGVVAVAGVRWLLERGTPPQPASSSTSGPLTLKRLTFDSGLQTDVTFSADGRFIAYASDRSGNFDIWVQPVDGGEPVQITRDPEQDVHPAWSPDGDSIAFRSERRGGGIFVMPALGGHARQLATFGSHPSWLNRSELLFLNGSPERGAATIQLFVARVDGEAPKEVLRDFTVGGGFLWAAGHPDGRISVMASHRERGFGLFTLSRDGQTVTTSPIPDSFPLRRPALDGRHPLRFRWNASGTALYLEATVDGIGNLWRVRVDPRTLELMRMERLTTGPGRDIAAALSADGRRLAYTAATEQTRVFVQSLSADGRSLADTAAPVTEAGADIFTSALSSDGRRLAYVMRRVGSTRFELRVANVETNASDLLDDDLDTDVHICWSADDSAILHQRIREVPGRADGGEAQIVRHAPGGRETVLRPWSSTTFLAGGGTAGAHEELGTTFNFAGVPSQIAVWAMKGDESPRPIRVLLSDAKANLWEPRYVPGYRWISFVREPLGEAQRVEMMIAPAQGSSPAEWTRLMADHPWADKPRWSVDGRLLYFLSPGSGHYFNLWAVPFDPIKGVATGTAFHVTHYDSPALFLAPNVGLVATNIVKGRVALTMASTSGSIWMLDNVEPAERTESR